MCTGHCTNWKQLVTVTSVLLARGLLTIEIVLLTVHSDTKVLQIAAH